MNQTKTPTHEAWITGQKDNKQMKKEYGQWCQEDNAGWGIKDVVRVERF